MNAQMKRLARLAQHLNQDSLDRLIAEGGPNESVVRILEHEDARRYNEDREILKEEKMAKEIVD